VLKVKEDAEKELRYGGLLQAARPRASAAMSNHKRKGTPPPTDHGNDEAVPIGYSIFLRERLKTFPDDIIEHE